ncbi:hypothetical protein [Variovorax boronicumulans]|uniref:hypothetical protein n=1 Tax=Variovorax boronicumulans TaxID=436515 RepID=UPI0033986875
MDGTFRRRIPAGSVVASTELPAVPEPLWPNFVTQLRMTEIPAVYRRFASVIGKDRWERRVAQMDTAIRNSPLLNNHLHSENAVAYALLRCGELIEERGSLPDAVPASLELYQAIAFARQVLWMMDAATPVEAERMRSRARDALENPDAMRGLRLELTLATHFARRGLQLQWPEMVGGGTFDLLIPQYGERGLEIECKSISNDKGRSIHRHEAIAVLQLLVRLLEPISASLRVGLRVVLTVPRRLPTRHEHRVALAQRILQQVLIGTSAQLPDGSDIRIGEFDPVASGNASKDGFMSSADLVTAAGSGNRETIVIVGGQGGALVVILQSFLGDDVVKATFATLHDAAKRQLTAKRPGLLAVGFDGLTPAQLRSIAEQDNDPAQPPTALRRPVSRLLSAPHRNHLIGVALLSRGEMQPPAADFVDSAGASYYFPNRTSRFWHADFSGLFHPLRPLYQPAPIDGGSRLSCGSSIE